MTNRAAEVGGDAAERVPFFRDYVSTVRLRARHYRLRFSERLKLVSGATIKQLSVGAVVCFVGKRENGCV